MSTLGKVLLFLNLLAAGGLIYFSVQDWSKRQEISGVVLRYQLTLQGLPIDTPKVNADDKDDLTVPIEVRSASGMTIERMSNKLLKTYFQGTDGGDIYSGAGQPLPLSLMDELNRAEKKLLSLVETQQGDEGKLRFLVGGKDASGLFQPGLLMRMAESFQERAAIRSLGFPAPPTPELLKANVDDASKRLNRKIAALKEPPAPKKLEELAKQIDELKKAVEKNPKDDAAKEKLAAISGQGQPPFTRDEADRRRRTALFLMLLDPSAAWQKRVMAVTGLRTYHFALNEQVARLNDIARQTERGMESDQATFEKEYDQLKELASRQDTLVRDQDRISKGLAEMENLDAASKAARETQLNNLKTELSNYQSQIAAVLGRQAAAEKAVFELQRKVGDTLRGNFDLETKLDQTEQKKP